MGDFSDSPKWKLVNKFTIYEDQNLSDRPFMRTCVPKRLEVEVSSFEIIRYIEWPYTYGDDKRPEHYADRSYMRFSGNLRDRIVVFTMADGEVATFKTLTDATIRPLPPGAIGGKNKATFSDGIEFSGMSSRDVPDEGLMAGEPGSLSFLPKYEEPRGGTTKSQLTAELHLDEDKFFSLMAELSDRSRQVTTFKVHLLAELFESEVSASLSEPWMTHDYGLLMQGTALAQTGVRLEGVAFSKGVTTIADGNASDEDDPSMFNKFTRAEDRNPSAPLSDPSRALVKYLRYVLLALMILIVVTLFSR